MATAAAVRSSRSQVGKSLLSRKIQKRGVKWPKEYSRKKWYMGPPQLPADIVQWMKDDELEKQERLEEQRTDILPPSPAFRGTSFIPVTFLPSIATQWHTLDHEEGRPKNEDETEANDDDAMGMRRVDEAIAYYRACSRRGVVPLKKLGPKMSFQEYQYLIEQCANEGAIARGKWAHAHALSHGLGKTKFICNNLMIMYCKCGCLQEAQEVFDDVIPKVIYSWIVLIQAYSRYNGLHVQALFKFRTMLLEQDDLPKENSMSTVIDVCAELGGSLGLKEGRNIHSMISDRPEFIRHTSVGNSLVTLYGRTGCIKEAQEAFRCIDEKSLVSWNSMITAFAQNGHCSQALECLAAMEVEGVVPDLATFMAILKALRGEEYLELGRGIHERMTRKLASSLDVAADAEILNMYARCGSIEDAIVAFEEMPEKDTVAWNSMVAAYSENGHSLDALSTFREMQFEGYKADCITFTTVVDACCNLGDVKTAREMQGWVAETGESTLELQIALLNLFGKHGSLEETIQIFNGISDKYTTSWNSMISSLLGRGLCQKALKLFRQMLWEGENLDRNTIFSCLDACSQLCDLTTARRFHSLIVETGLPDVSVANSVISMYAKCGGLEEAKNVFDNIRDKNLVSWNALVSASKGKEAFELVRQMDHQGLQPDRVTFINLLGSCGSLQDVRMVHSRVANLVDIQLYTALIDLYGKCGSPDEAKQIFRKMHRKDAVTWTAMLGVFVDNGDGYSALELGREMDADGVNPNNACLVHLLEACKLLNDLEAGKLVHEKMASCSEKLDIVLGMALFDMYARCGDLEKTRIAFEEMNPKPLVAWNGMISA